MFQTLVEWGVMVVAATVAWSVKWGFIPAVYAALCYRQQRRAVRVAKN